MIRRTPFTLLVVMWLAMIAPVVARADHASQNHWPNTNGFPIRLEVWDYTPPSVYDHEHGNYVRDMTNWASEASNGKILATYVRKPAVQCDDIANKFRPMTIKACEDHTNFSYTGLTTLRGEHDRDGSGWHIDSALVKLFPAGAWGDYQHHNLCHELFGHALMGLNHSELPSCTGTESPLWPTAHDRQAVSRMYDHRD